jgi:hypothetical protein
MDNFRTGTIGSCPISIVSIIACDVVGIIVVWKNRSSTPPRQVAGLFCFVSVFFFASAFFQRPQLVCLLAFFMYINSRKSQGLIHMMQEKPFDEALLDNYSDEELFEYFERSPPLVTVRTEAVRELSPGLVAKHVCHFVDPRDEAYAMERARSVGVNTPVVRRIATHVEDADEHLLIMDRVRGKTLEQLWPHIGLWESIRIAWELRRFLRAMASVTSGTTGGLHSGVVRSIHIDAVHGPVPHASPTTFSNYLNWWLTECRPYWCEPRPDLTFSPTQHVLVHQDLAPRNLMLDVTRNLWIIDWNHSGYYPAFMEYMGVDAVSAGLDWFRAPTWASWWGRMRWDLLRFIACGFARKHRRAIAGLNCVCHRTQRFRADRNPFSANN